MAWLNWNRRFFSSLAVVVLALLPGASVLAGQDRGPVPRIVHGRVETKAGTPIKGAVVYLKDDRSSSVKSAISLDDGTYRFVQLSQGTDYELWAQSDSKKSKTKSISSFDTKADITLDLTID
jgi:hypothetical protein